MPAQINITKVSNGFLIEVVDRINNSVEAFVFTSLDDVITKVKETL